MQVAKNNFFCSDRLRRILLETVVIHEVTAMRDPSGDRPRPQPSTTGDVKRAPDRPRPKSRPQPPASFRHRQKPTHLDHQTHAGVCGFPARSCLDPAKPVVGGFVWFSLRKWWLLGRSLLDKYDNIWAVCERVFRSCSWCFVLQRWLLNNALDCCW
jgi:hypothetical protein